MVQASLSPATVGIVPVANISGLPSFCRQQGQGKDLEAEQTRVAKARLLGSHDPTLHHHSHHQGLQARDAHQGLGGNSRERDSFNSFFVSGPGLDPEELEHGSEALKLKDLMEAVLNGYQRQDRLRATEPRTLPRTCQLILDSFMNIDASFFLPMHKQDSMVEVMNAAPSM